MTDLNEYLGSFSTNREIPFMEQLKKKPSPLTTTDGVHADLDPEGNAITEVAVGPSNLTVRNKDALFVSKEKFNEMFTKSVKGLYEDKKRSQYPTLRLDYILKVYASHPDADLNWVKSAIEQDKNTILAAGYASNPNADLDWVKAQIADHEYVSLAKGYASNPNADLDWVKTKVSCNCNTSLAEGYASNPNANLNLVKGWITKYPINDVYRLINGYAANPKVDRAWINGLEDQSKKNEFDVQLSALNYVEKIDNALEHVLTPEFTSRYKALAEIHPNSILGQLMAAA